MTLKLKSVTFSVAPRIPGVRPGALSTIDCDNPHSQLIDWQISVRGQSIFFISPPGWVTNDRLERDPKGPVQIHEVPRADATLSWTGDIADIENALKSVKFDTGPMRTPAPEATVPAAQAATA